MSGGPLAGVHVLELPAPGAVARALRTLAWPLALLGKPSEIRLRGPNHCEGSPTFHDLRLGWVPLAAKLKVPLLSENVERVSPLASFLRITLALGTTAPA